MVYFDSIKDRTIVIASYLVENRTTVREAAKHFGVSKSTVHKDITEKLRQYDRTLYEAAEEILQINKSERHLRGGEATRKKYRIAKIGKTL